MVPSLTYRPDIDGLRAVAILSVILFHAFPEAVTGGFFGVDVFFVISGYLITGLILKEMARDTGASGLAILRHFYARRVRRLFPALILVLLSCLIVGWYVLLAEEYKQLGKQVLAGAAFVENLTLLSDVGYFDTAAEYKPLLHLWSLGIEEQFYLLWPLLLVLCIRWRRNHLVLAIGIVALSLAANVIATERHAAFAFYSPVTRLWELMAGALLAQMEFRRAEIQARQVESSRTSLNNQKDVCALLGALLLFAAFFAIDEHFSLPGWWALLPTAGTCLLVWAGPQAWLNRTWLSSRPFVFVGLISYPLYLWHWPLLAFARILQGKVLGGELRLILVAAAFVLAWATYRFVEKRLRGKEHWSVTSILVGLLVLMGAAGYNIHSRDGLEFRLKGSEVQRVKFNTTLLYQHQCRTDFKFAADSFCLRGNDTQPVTVALIGDSHALNLYPGLGQKFADQGDNLVLFGIGGGIPFYGVERVVNERLTAYYSPLYGSILDHVIADRHIRTVLLMNKAPSAGEDILRYVGQQTGQDGPDLYASYGQAMSNTLERLLDAGKEVIFIVDSPRMDFDPGACLARLPGAEPARRLCAIPRKLHERQTAAYRQKIAEILAQYPSVKRWDLAETLCDKQYCWAMRDGKILYGRDGHHLTIDASYWLVERFFPQ